MTQIRFAGKATGLKAMSLPGFGIVKAGDEIEVDDETARRWTKPRNGKREFVEVKPEKAKEPEPAKAESVAEVTTEQGGAAAGGTDGGE